MKMTYYLHGLPKGFDLVGNPLEKDFFFQNFYSRIFKEEHGDGAKGHTELRIEGLMQDGVPAYYYTYFIGDNISRYQEARAGYIAVTIKLDCYYKKARNLMFLLDSFLNGYIKKLVLNDNGNQYQINDFSRVAAAVNAKFNKHLITLIESTFNKEDIVKTNFPSQRKRVKLNLSDATDAAVEQCFAKYGEVSISDVYPSFKATEAIKNKKQEIEGVKSSQRNEIDKIKTKYQTLLNAREDEIASIKRQQSGSTNQVQSLKEQLDDTRAKYNKVNGMISQIKEIIGGVETICPPTVKKPTSPTGMEDKNRSHNGVYLNDGVNKKKWVFSALIALFVMIVLAATPYLYKSCSHSKDVNTEQIDSNSTDVDPIYESDEVPKVDNSTLWIDIREFKSGVKEVFNVGDKIHVKIKGNPEDIIGKFVSILPGLEIGDEGLDGKTEITITQPGDLMLDYQDSQGRSLLKCGARTVKVR